jgi:hypothetical protein
MLYVIRALIDPVKIFSDMPTQEKLNEAVMVLNKSLQVGKMWLAWLAGPSH